MYKNLWLHQMKKNTPSRQARYTLQKTPDCSEVFLFFLTGNMTLVYAFQSYETV